MRNAEHKNEKQEKKRPLHEKPALEQANGQETSLGDMLDTANGTFPEEGRDTDPLDGIITAAKVWGHFRTITQHRMLVMRYCFAVGLYRQGLMHDLSKYSPTEFLAGCRYYQDGKRSPNNGEREAIGYSSAWMHHKGRNRHHFEFWNDYSVTAGKNGRPPLQAVQMPRRYVVEMLMDRIAASRIYLKDQYNRHEPLKYFLKGKGHYLMNQQTAKELERMLRILDKKGERALFRFVRKYYLKGYPM